MNRKNQKKFSLKPENSSENIGFSLPSINNIEKKPSFTSKDKEKDSNPANYNFINADYQKKLANLLGNSLSETEKVFFIHFFLLNFKDFQRKFL